MDTLFAARVQMELSLGFHMIFAALGIGMPLLMVLAEALHLRGHGDHWKALARSWGKATAVLFVVGAVSGTALSFELGLLWPRFLAFAGPVVGPAFTLEGYAFLLEAIFVGLYLYGWDKLTPKQHLLAGIPVAVTGALSGILVVGANAFMQSPRGYMVDPLDPFRVTEVDALAVFRNPSWAPLAAHSAFACYAAVGFAMAALYAFAILRRGKTEARVAGFRLAMIVGVVAVLVQPLTGDRVAKLLHATQPEKLAAMEAHFHTERGAGIWLGGIPDPANETVKYGVQIPKMLSVLATGSLDGEVRGLAEFPRDERPNVVVCHVAFQLMVGAGSLLMGFGAAWLLALWKRRALTDHKLTLLAAVACGPLGFLALEAGWVVTEAGRQPWVVYRVMRTAEGVTTRTDIGWSLVVLCVLYTVLLVATVGLLRRLGRENHA